METTTCLPEDILIQEILICLPVKSLLRFKSVCKSWRELIDTSYLIDLHNTFNSSSSSSKFGSTFILQTDQRIVDDSYEADIKMFMLSSSSGPGDHGDQGDGDGDDDKKKEMVFNVDEDFGFSQFYKDFQLTDSILMVSSCNGIICLFDSQLTYDYKGSSKQHYSNIRDVFLWNPATRQFRILPKSLPIEIDGEPDYYRHFDDTFIAFGFDVKTKDYKVLRISPYIPWVAPDLRREETVFTCRVQVYSLSTDSWRLLEGIISLPVVPTEDLSFNRGIYLNGSCFFVGNKFNAEKVGVCDFMLLSFDFTKEIFTTMQFPDNCSSQSKLVLNYLGDKIAIFTTPNRIHGDCDVYEYYDIWVLNEHGSGCVVNKESWTKLHSFPIKNRIYSEPRCISNNGEFALLSTVTHDKRSTEKLQLFNLVTKARNDFLIGTSVCRTEVYKESLVSIMGSGNVLLKWQLPTHGTTYRLNLDAPFIASYTPFGIGLCLTSDTTGGCIGVRSLQRGDVSDAEEGEALTILEAIKWAKELELSPIIIESDSKKCVSFFMDDDDDNNLTCWNLGTFSLLREAMLLLNSSKLGISFQYCYKSCNYVTDVASKLGREGSWVCMDWTANFPGEVVRSLNRDLGKKIGTWEN